MLRNRGDYGDDRVAERPRDFRAGGIATTARAERIPYVLQPAAPVNGQEKIVSKTDGKSLWYMKKGRKTCPKFILKSCLLLCG
jgi:hypothetical protein